jgi:hypothetical protein
MSGEKITIKYDPKKDRLIISNITGYMKFLEQKIKDFKGGESLSVDLNLNPNPTPTSTPPLGIIKLGGIRKCVKISEKDIKQNRKELLKKLGEIKK